MNDNEIENTYTDFITIGSIKYKIPKWGMRKQLAYNNLFLPLISGPLVAGLAYKSDEEEKQLAAIVSGLIDAIAESDLMKIAEICLEGVEFKAEGKPLKLATIEGLEAADVTLADIYQIIAVVINKNLGSLLKKDFLNSLMLTAGISAVESLS